MRCLILTLLFLGTAVLASPEASLEQSCRKSELETLHYALKIMKMRDKPQIRTALHSYGERLASIPSEMDAEAFGNGTFDRELFLRKSPGVLRAEAQADLFEQIFAVLDSSQKKELHRLMAAHPYDTDALQKQESGITRLRYASAGACRAY